MDASKVQSIEDLPKEGDVSLEDVNLHRVQGTGEDSEQGQSSERLDEIASARYGDPGWWRVIASFNAIDDPWSLPPGQVLMIPPGTASSGGGQ
jgi:hypothetical protein